MTSETTVAQQPTNQSNAAPVADSRAKHRHPKQTGTSSGGNVTAGVTMGADAMSRRIEVARTIRTNAIPLPNSPRDNASRENAKRESESAMQADRWKRASCVARRQ
jgi:hypothetical protein